MRDDYAVDFNYRAGQYRSQANRHFWQGVILFLLGATMVIFRLIGLVAI